MDNDDACFMHLAIRVVHKFLKAVDVYDIWHISTKRSQIHSKKKRGQPWELWSLVSTTDRTILPQDIGDQIGYLNVKDLFYVNKEALVTLYSCISEYLSIIIIIMIAGHVSKRMANAKEPNLKNSNWFDRITLICSMCETVSIT